MTYYTDEQIKKARSIDLLTYLQTYEPTELVHVRGNTYCTREHDSLKISNGKWMWWSRGFGGNSALDYLIKVKSMSFMDAMKVLTEGASFLHHFDANICRKDGCERERKLLLPERADTNLEVIRYLTERGIDESIIRDCIDNGLLYESLPYHNCIFIGNDENGNPAYAFYRATNGERMMGDAAGSDKRYSFRINCNGSTLHVFESAIDLLSFATLCKMQTGEWRTDPMLSLGGVYVSSPNKPVTKLPSALDNALQNYPAVTTIALHLDNDHAGRSAAGSISEQLRARFIIKYEPPPTGKDYNDHLMRVRQHYKPKVLDMVR